MIGFVHRVTLTLSNRCYTCNHSPDIRLRDRKTSTLVLIFNPAATKTTHIELKTSMGKTIKRRPDDQGPLAIGKNNSFNFISFFNRNSFIEQVVQLLACF
jgi:hypothetical protein